MFNKLLWLLIKLIKKLKYMCNCSSNCGCNSTDIPVGLQGPMGPQGPEGPQGIQGEPGQALISGEGVPTQEGTYCGQPYMDAVVGQIYTWNCDTNTWNTDPVNTLIGPQGPKGDKGDPGDSGSGSGGATAFILERTTSRTSISGASGEVAELTKTFAANEAGEYIITNNYKYNISGTSINTDIIFRIRKNGVDVSDIQRTFIRNYGSTTVEALYDTHSDLISVEEGDVISIHFVHSGTTSATCSRMWSIYQKVN
jgi:hypothetical protein